MPLDFSSRGTPVDAANSRPDFSARAVESPKAADKPGIGSSFSNFAKDFASGTASDFSAGAKMAKSAMDNPTGFFAAPKFLLGGLQELLSPFGGVSEAVKGSIKRALPKSKASDAIAETAGELTTLFGPGAVDRGMMKGVQLVSNLLTRAGRLKYLKPTESAVRTLLNEGIDLTPGEVMGVAVKRLEDAARSIPGTGDVISAAQQRSLQSFNKAVINKSLSQIGDKLPKDIEAGIPAIEYAQAEIGNRYDHLLPKLTFRWDGQVGQGVAQIRTSTDLIASGKTAEFDKIVKDTFERLRKGQGSGKIFKQVDSELSVTSGKFTRSSVASERELGLAVGQFQGLLREALERANPKYVGELDSLNRAWALFKRAEGASVRRAASSGLFTPADLLSDIKKSTTQSIFARGDGLLQPLANAGQEVLATTVPDSGTARRFLTSEGALKLGGLMASGAGAGAATGAGAERGLEVAAGLLAPVPFYTQMATKALSGAARAAPAAKAATRRVLPFLGPAGALDNLLSQDRK